MFFNNNNNKIIAIILVLMIICTVFAGATVSASAVDFVLTPSVIACVGAVLVACGLTFNSSLEMSAVVQKVWDSVPDAVKSAMVSYGQKYLDNLNSGKPFILTLSEPIVSALSSWFADNVVDNKIDNVEYGGFELNQKFYWYNGDSTHGTTLTMPRSVANSISFSSLTSSSIDLIKKYSTIIGYVADSAVYQMFYKGNSDGDVYSMLWFSAAYGRNYFPAPSWGTGSHYSDYDYINQGVITSQYMPSRRNSGNYFQYIFDSVARSVTIICAGYDRNIVLDSYNAPNFVDWVCSNGEKITTSVSVNSDYAPTSTSDNALTKDTAVYVPNSVYQDGALSSEGVESMTTAGVRDTAGAETSSQTGLLSSIWEWLKSILDAITSGFSSVLEWLKSMLQSLVDAISGVASAVIEGVKSLFYPQGFTWDSFISEVQSLAPSTNVDFRSYATEIEIPDVTMTTKYGTHTVVDNSPIRDNIETIRKYLGAFLTALLVIFNANMVMKFLGMTSFSITDSRVNHETVDNSYKAIDKKMGKKGGR